MNVLMQLLFEFHYPMAGDWAFASPRMRGEQPYWPDNLMKRTCSQSHVKTTTRTNGQRRAKL
jgi:hypothetical protein